MSKLLPGLSSRAALRRRIALIYLLLAGFNLGAWIWAFLAFHGRPLLLSTGLLAYGFGLRHAVDADHIAAIDNVIRKLMQAGRRPVTVGLFFAAGHSSVVMLVTAGVAAMTAGFAIRFEAWKALGSAISTGISALFLFLVAAMNFVILRGLWRAFRHLRDGTGDPGRDLAHVLDHGGVLARLYRPAFRLVSASWHMLPLGFLFGLGFDTATEVSLLAISATEASKGISIWSVTVFPLLFAAAMTLVDTTDGIMMLGAYDWALAHPVRRLYYNLTVTLLSVAAAVTIGGIETLGLIASRFQLIGPVWSAVSYLNDHFDVLGFGILGAFLCAWMVCILVYRRPGDERVRPGGAGA